MPSGLSLNCFICGDANLDEFGECNTQFQYDCANYAKRFSENEQIYCRTTRQKSLNNTYTIMKECISDTDHFKMFPKKTSKLDEECDLVDVDGAEIAYCLCKTGDYCNQKPISEQFIKFEEEHPELFENDVNENKEKIDLIESGRKMDEIESDLKRHPSNTNLQKNSEIDKDVLSTSSLIPSLPITDVGQKKPIIPEISNGRQFGNGLNNIKKISSTNNLYCVQCAQGKLEDEYSDCNQMKIVECASLPSASPSNKNYCFSRQIIIGQNKNAVEKMCVSHEALAQEYGKDAKVEGCETSENGKIRYCVCSGSECNRDSISTQIDKNKVVIEKLPNLTPVKVDQSKLNPIKPLIKQHLSCNVCSQSDLTLATSDCTTQLSNDCLSFGDSKNFCLTRQTQLSSGLFNVEKRCISENEFRENFPEEQLHNKELQVGCASVFDGFVNYCICDTNNCNKESLIGQVQKINNKGGLFNDQQKSINSEDDNVKKSQQNISTNPISPKSAQSKSLNTQTVLVPVNHNILNKPILTSKATSEDRFEELLNKDSPNSIQNEKDSEEDKTTKSILEINHDRIEKWKESDILSTSFSGGNKMNFSIKHHLFIIPLTIFYLNIFYY
uniref:UPAR/Ly6 domain-containing protein n=1 Tax=Parastrongyloides trichosuri TaxID=131310 RepID=A0A0N5A3G0_PARTI